MIMVKGTVSGTIIRKRERDRTVSESGLMIRLKGTVSLDQGT